MFLNLSLNILFSFSLRRPEIHPISHNTPTSGRIMRWHYLISFAPHFGDQYSFELSQERVVFIHYLFGSVQRLAQSGIIAVSFL